MRSSHSFLLLSVLAACTHAVSSPPASVSPDRVVPAAKVEADVSAAPQPALTSIDFAAHGLADAGCFLLRDVTSGFEQVSSVERCAEGRRPNSTFKVANALIGADLGLLTSADSIMHWDPVLYPKQSWWSEEWNRDQPLRDAMRISAVPLFQKLASEIGPERMAEYLAKFDYGNRDMSAGIDRFWLEGGMRITAAQQLELISKLVREELPVSKQAHAIVKEVLKKDPIAGFPHAGKTGSGSLENAVPAADGVPLTHHAMVGWMIGWIELARGPVAYAMWVEAPSFEALRELRLRTVDSVLTEVARKW